MGSSSPNLPEEIYEYWKELKLVEYMSEETFEMIDDNPIRDAFVKVLRKGTKDNGRKRHALSLKELLPLINNFLGRTSENEKIKLTALYHHRDKLLEGGLIQEVVTILEGKRYTTYYGRTAKGFILADTALDKRNQKKEEMIKMMKSVLIELNPLKSETEIVDFLSQYFDSMIDNFEIIHEWVQQNEELMQKSDIDIIELMNFMQNFTIAYPSIIEQTRKLGQLLKIDAFS